MKITLEREVLHQLARDAIGSRNPENRHGRPEPISNVSDGRLRIAAQQLADATAVRGPVEIEIID